MTATRSGRTPRKRALSWGVHGCAALIVAIVVVMVVVASIVYLELSEPDSAFPSRLAEAAQAAGDGGRIALLSLADGPADTIHLFSPGATDAAAVERCLGFAWDKAELIAGHLTDGMPGAFVVVADGAVVDYGWHLVAPGSLALADWPCGLTAADDSFVVTVEGDLLTLRRAPGEVPD